MFWYRASQTVPYTRSLGSHQNADSDSGSLGWGLRFCILNKLPADPTAGPGATLWAVRPYPRFFHRRTELGLEISSLNVIMSQIPSSRKAEIAWLLENSYLLRTLSDQLVNDPNRILKDLDDLKFLSKCVIYRSYQRDWPQCPGYLTETLCITRNVSSRGRGTWKRQAAPKISVRNRTVIMPINQPSNSNSDWFLWRLTREGRCEGRRQRWDAARRVN